MKWWQRIPVLSPLDAYNRWAATYYREDNPIKNYSDQYILSSAIRVNGRDVLDAGCGAGKICHELFERRAASVHGIDLSPAMIEQARSHCPAARFEVGDLMHVQLHAQSYDTVICGLVLGHIDDFEVVVSKLVNALREGGQLILTDFHPSQTKARAKRTFKDTVGKTFEVKHSLHTLEQYRTLLLQLGMADLQWYEPTYKGVPVIFGVTGTKR